MADKPATVTGDIGRTVQLARLGNISDSTELSHLSLLFSRRQLHKQLQVIHPF